ncbi:MAG: hypothetical protein IH602_11530 [Bryobacteraceae bacterium]|nr:hypothetical protein [Bryobacteraceae bacterium]
MSRMLVKLLSALLVVSFGFAAAPAVEFAGGDQGGRGKQAKAGGKNPSGRAAAPVFGSRDRDIISGYYRTRRSNLPPGLAKRNGQLPPGLERQLQRNGTLPPGLQKRIEVFPRELNRQLPPLPYGYVRGLLGGSAVVVNQRTGAIVDVIQNLLIDPGK